MTTSPKGRKLIESFEGLSLTAYQDQRGIWTIGYGHTGPEVTKGLVWTQDMADATLAADLTVAEGAVNRLVHVPLNQNQFDALVSLCYNIGQGNFASSTVLHATNLQLWDSAASAFLMWCKVNGVENAGLMRRREAERNLFLTPPVLP